MSTYRIFWEWNGMIYVKHVAKCLAPNKHPQWQLLLHRFSCQLQYFGSYFSIVLYDILSMPWTFLSIMIFLFSNWILTFSKVWNSLKTRNYPILHEWSMFILAWLGARWQITFKSRHKFFPLEEATWCSFPASGSHGYQWVLCV